MHSPLGNNNQLGGGGASQTSDNVVRNQSLLTGCCCKAVRAPIGSHWAFLSHASLPIMWNIALGMVSGGMALLDAEGGTKFLHQGRHKVGTPVTQ